MNGLEKSGACTTFVAAIANLFSKNIWFLEVTFLSRTALYIFVDTILQEMAFGLKESFKHRNVCISFHWSHYINFLIKCNVLVFRELGSDFQIKDFSNVKINEVVKHSESAVVNWRSFCAVFTQHFFETCHGFELWFST